jgi:hypothetical protein
MEKQGVSLSGDLTVDNAKKVFDIFLGNIGRYIFCTTSRKDVDEGEPTFQFFGFYSRVDIDYNYNDKKKFIIVIYYKPNCESLEHRFSSFGNVLHLNHIHRIAYEMKDRKLVIKYFCKGSKTPASFMVFQFYESEFNKL